MDARSFEHSNGDALHDHDDDNDEDDDYDDYENQGDRAFSSRHSRAARDYFYLPTSSFIRACYKRPRVSGTQCGNSA